MAADYSAARGVAQRPLRLEGERDGITPSLLRRRADGIAGWIASLGTPVNSGRAVFTGTRGAVRKFFLQSGKPEQANSAWHLHHACRPRSGADWFGDAMKDFSEAAFVPEIVDAMTQALDASIATLPHPVSSTQVNQLAESILRTAKQGERDPAVLQRMALLELQIRPRG